MKIWKTFLSASKEVYRNPRYIFLTALTAIILIAFNVLINNYKLLLSTFSLPLVSSLFFGGITIMPRISLFILIIIALLAGMVISFSVYLMQRQIRGSVSSGPVGILTGVIAPACPSCAIGLLSTLGMGGFLAILPFKGLELGVLGVVILLFSAGYLSKKICTKTCSIKWGDKT